MHVEGDGEQVLELFTRLVEKVLHELVGALAFVRLGAECHHNRKYRWRTTWSPAYVWLHPMGVQTVQWEAQGSMLSV